MTVCDCECQSYLSLLNLVSIFSYVSAFLFLLSAFLVSLMHVCCAGKDQGYDVVLVDTAGRMQDNEPLMRALTKVLVCCAAVCISYHQHSRFVQLVATNNPDLILFVGEALVGNEAVDQLVKFNKV